MRMRIRHIFPRFLFFCPTICICWSDQFSPLGVHWQLRRCRQWVFSKHAFIPLSQLYFHVLDPLHGFPAPIHNGRHSTLQLVKQQRLNWKYFKSNSYVFAFWFSFVNLSPYLYIAIILFYCIWFLQMLFGLLICWSQHPSAFENQFMFLLIRALCCGFPSVHTEAGGKAAPPPLHTEREGVQAARRCHEPPRGWLVARALVG